jgi:hypothetical protein
VKALIVLPIAIGAVAFAHHHRRLHMRHDLAERVETRREFIPPPNFPADAYPSQAAAVQALAAQLPDTIRDVTPNPRHVEVSGDLPSDQLDLLRRSCNRNVEASDFDKGAVQVIVQQSERKDAIVPWGSSPAPQGNFHARVTGERGERVLAVSFSEKPWVERFADFVNAHPGRTWLVGRSGPCASEADALREAQGNIARELQKLIQQRLPGPAGRDAGRWLTSFNADELVVDQFAQRFGRPYGDVWAVSVLADVPAEKIDAITQQFSGEIRAAHSHRARSIAAGAVLFVALSLLYVTANAVTRGYYTTRLRIVAVLLATAGVLMLA